MTAVTLAARARVRVDQAALAALEPRLAARRARPRRRPRPVRPVAERRPTGATGTPTAGYNAVERSLGGIYLAQLAFGVLGVMVVTGEYATGTIRSTFAAVPRRLPVLWSKLGVFLAVTLVLGTIACVLAFVAGQAIFATKHVDASFGDPGVAARRARLRALPGRDGRASGSRSARCCATPPPRSRRSRCVLFVVPVIVDLLPKGGRRSARTCPSRGGADDHVGVDPAARSAPWAGFGVLCAYVVATIALAAVMLVRRDA